jgi:nitrate reductase alpha subunit
VPDIRDSSTNVGMDTSFTDSLLRIGRHFQRGEASEDLRTVHQIGGRSADVFYRDRWAYDKVVRSTHGVNCTGSCSWKIYVKDGIITWEAQQTDYPSIGPDKPEYEPRGCPRGASLLLVHLLAGQGALPVCARHAASVVPRG